MVTDSRIVADTDSSTVLNTFSRILRTGYWQYGQYYRLAVE